MYHVPSKGLHPEKEDRKTGPPKVKKPPQPVAQERKRFRISCDCKGGRQGSHGGGEGGARRPVRGAVDS